MMDCRNALTATSGDMNLAIENLRKAGIANAEKRADRVASEGRIVVDIAPDQKSGSMLELNSETDFVSRNEDFASVAQAMGVFGRRVEQPGDLEQALTDAFAYDGPAVVDVVTARQELSIPPAITVEQAKGFSLYAIRTILAGRADELLDLVTTNVARRILD